MKLTYDYIKSLSPCYDPIKYISKDWSGTAIDLLQINEIPMQDILWVICRKDILDEGLMRRFAAWCAAEALFVAKQTDKRSWNAVEVSVKFSIGEATQEQLAAARDAARAAAWAAAWDAAWDAALAAAWDAARAAAWAAAWDAQRAKLISMIKGRSDFTLSELLNNYPIERT
jgi:hypothetical protein